MSQPVEAWLAFTLYMSHNRRQSGARIARSATLVACYQSGPPISAPSIIVVSRLDKGDHWGRNSKAQIKYVSYLTSNVDGRVYL